MQTLSQMWGSAPGTFLLLAALAAALLMVVLSYVVGIIEAVIDGVIRLFHGYPESQRVSIPLDEDDSDFGDDDEDDEDDEDEDHPGIGMTDRQMQCLADRLVGEIVPKALIEVSRHADLLDRLALKIADRQNELNADATADDALVAKIADAVRDRVNEVTVSATDLDLFAAKVMELADKRRAEREAAKKQHNKDFWTDFEAACKAMTPEEWANYKAESDEWMNAPMGNPVEPVATPELPKDGEYKRDDLIEVLKGDEWCPGWYVNFFKSHDADMWPHHVAFISGFNSDGEADIDDAYMLTDDIRRRRPAAT